MRAVHDLRRIGGLLTFSLLLSRCSGTSASGDAGDAGDAGNGGAVAGEAGGDGGGAKTAKGGSAGSVAGRGGGAGALAGGAGKGGTAGHGGGQSGAAGSAGISGAGGAAAAAGTAGAGAEGGEGGAGGIGVSGEAGESNAGESGESSGGGGGESNGGAGGAVEPPRLDGDLCTNALTLETNTSGSTVGFTNDHQSVSCIRWSLAGPDVAYSLSVPPMSRFQITADPSDDFDVALYVVSPPADNCAAVPVCTRAADDVAKAGGNETLILDNHGIVPQSYFLVVDGYGAETNAGAYELTVAELPIPAGEVCETALPLAIGEPVPATLDGWAHDYTAHPACTAVPANGGDAVYTLTVPAGNTLTLSATPLDVMDIALYAFDVASAVECGTATTCLALSDAGFGGDTETLVYTNPGEDRTIFVHVDRFDRGSALGHYTLTATLAPATPPTP